MFQDPSDDPDAQRMLQLLCAVILVLPESSELQQQVPGEGRRGRRGKRFQAARMALEQAEAFQQAWLFDAALSMVTDAKGPREKAVKAAALVGLERFSEAREVVDEINWKDILVTCEAGIDRAEFLEHCEVLERQSGAKSTEDSQQFSFSDIFGPMLRAHESGRDPAMPMTETAALLPPVPEAASGVEILSSAGGRGLVTTAAIKAGHVMLCGLPLARCINFDKLGEPLVPVLRQAAENSAHVRHVLSLLSDGVEPAPDVSLEKFSWRGPCDAKMPTEERLANIVRINSFDVFGSSALFGAISMANHSCCPSAKSMAVGNAIFVRAHRDLPIGEEVQISYFDVLKPFQQRQQLTQSWLFQCRCPRCKFEESLPSKLQEIAEVDDIESAIESSGFSTVEANWVRASQFESYMKELEGLFPLSKEADQRRKLMLKAMEVTDPASFTHAKLSFLDWLAKKSLKGPKDSETLQAMQYCDYVHQCRYGKVPGQELVPLLKCTQQATESTGVGREFCNPWKKTAEVSPPPPIAPSQSTTAAMIACALLAMFVAADEMRLCAGAWLWSS
eukprot:Skav223309  [mRNA]  locus=scaffold4198:348615:353883:- [translate_table: standard]